jgi:hypothetical protein
MRDHTVRTFTPATRRRARSLALAAFVAGALLALAAGAAQAVIVTRGHHRVSYERLPGKALGATPSARSQARPALSKAPLKYHGGSVMPSNTNYVIYWDPSGGAAFPAGYEAGINRYFEALSHDSGGLLNADSVLAQYGDENGASASYNSHFGGFYNDTDPYPANGCTAAPTCLTGAQLEAELATFVQSRALPADLQHEYFLLTPKGVENCETAEGLSCSAGAGNKSYCAFHSFVELGKGAVLVFAVDPYVSGLKCADEKNLPNGNPSDETIAGGLAHEHSESVTDPQLNAWYDSKGNEVADKCRTGEAESEYGLPLGTAPDGSDYNEVIDGALYWYQQVWSNEVTACAQRQLHTPTIKKVKPKSGPEAGGTEVAITGTGFTEGTTVTFGEAAATDVSYESPTSIVAVTPPGIAGKVNVTVTTAGGTSTITNKTRFKYKKAKVPRGH